MSFVDYENHESSIFAKYNNLQVDIPASDVAVWQLLPSKRRFLFKPNLCEYQKIPYGIAGQQPPFYPVFEKPVINLYGLGHGACLIEHPSDHVYKPGYFWMPVCLGRHISTDVALLHGNVVWYQHVEGHPSTDQMFDYWETIDAADLELSLIKLFVKNYLPNYTGIINVEQIGGIIIELTFRWSGQFIPLYQHDILDYVCCLYTSHTWPPIASNINKTTKSYSVPIFTSYKYPATIIDSIATKYRSIKQVTFVDHQQSSPRGGHLIGYINSIDLREAKQLRSSILTSFHEITPPSNVVYVNWKR